MNKWTHSLKSLIEAARSPVASSAVPTVYESINDVPLALRRSLIRHHNDGLSARQIGVKLSLPEYWVRLFVETPARQTKH